MNKMKVDQYSLAPICLFVYNRLSLTKQTVLALQNNFLAKDTDLIIFSDGPKNSIDQLRVKEVRLFLKTVTGFKKVIIYEAEKNLGLANSIIDGVTKVIEEYGKIIVLEDDLICTSNFLDYMNQALKFYQNDERIISVCGYGLKINRPVGYTADVYSYGRSSSWGWGTWVNRWETIDWEVKDWPQFKHNKKAIKAFKKNGSDMFQMLRSVTEGNAESWAIRFSYAQFKQNKYSIMPFLSKIENKGFGAEGTNTKYKYSRFRTEMDTQQLRLFHFEKNIQPNNKILAGCYKYHSISIRIYSRIRYILNV